MGFEPTVRVNGQQFSRLSHSTTLPPLRNLRSFRLRLATSLVFWSCFSRTKWYNIYNCQFVQKQQAIEVFESNVSSEASTDDYYSLRIHHLARVLYCIMLFASLAHFLIFFVCMNRKHTLNYLTNFFPLQFWKDNKQLRAVCKELDWEDIASDPIQLLCYALRELMWEYDWVGLAAPQIGQDVRIIAVSSWIEKRKESKFDKQTIMINPIITFQSEKTFISEEGCLSLPNIIDKVERHHSITVRYLDESWQQHEQKLTGFNAAIVQHEVDHLDGILFIDKIIS